MKRPCRKAPRSVFPECCDLSLDWPSHVVLRGGVGTTAERQATAWLFEIPSRVGLLQRFLARTATVRVGMPAARRVARIEATIVRPAQHARRTRSALDTHCRALVAPPVKRSRAVPWRQHTRAAKTTLPLTRFVPARTAPLLLAATRSTPCSRPRQGASLLPNPPEPSPRREE